MTDTRRGLERHARDALRDAGHEHAETEARWIVAEATGAGGVTDDVVVTQRTARAVADMVARRLAGEPLQYVLGSWSFRGLDLLVDRRVLIPRPETEVTAQVAIDEATRRGARRGRRDPWSGSETAYDVADLGTGSGAIALALAVELPDAAVWAADASAEALAVARANLAGIGTAATRIRLREGSWFDALPDELHGRLRVIVANPPYVSEDELLALPTEVAEHEPRLALVSGPTGLEAIEQIVDGATAWLEPGGALVLEIAPHQRDAVTARADAVGLCEVRVEQDLVGRDRVVVARAPDMDGS